MFFHLNVLNTVKTMVVNVKHPNKMQFNQVFFKFTLFDLWTIINTFFSPANSPRSSDPVGIFYTFSNIDTFFSRNTEAISIHIF